MPKENRISRAELMAQLEKKLEVSDAPKLNKDMQRLSLRSAAFLLGDAEKPPEADLLDRAEAVLRPTAGPVEVRFLKDQSSWRSGDIFRLAAYLRENMPLHNETLGTHGCLLMHRGEILCCCEDMGRSSALDKAVGEALARDLPLNECVLYTTGRVSAEIAQKAFTAGARVLASRTLPTLEAVALAQKRGLTLIGRAWEEQYEVFAQPETTEAAPGL